MQTAIRNLIYVSLLSCWTITAYAQSYQSQNFDITRVQVTHHADIAVTVWEIQVAGKAGATTPRPAGQMDGAPVLGYVFPTSLDPVDVGFGSVDGILALALTSHPDFDDTPLWDENGDHKLDNDGIVWHPHWVVLAADKRVKGGLSVVQFKSAASVVLPPTNPGMPMYMDSPGFAVITNKNSIKVVVPDYRISNNIQFKYDGVSAFMRVNTSNPDLPLLGVYEVFSVSSGDLSLPYSVKNP